MHEAATNSDRPVRLGSMCCGAQESISELSDQVAQLRELQSLLQEQSNTILERTPKLPARKAPAESTAASTAPPPTPQPQQQQLFAQGPVHPQPTAHAYDQHAQPLHLSEHIQPLVSRDA